jgi:hypothetical protein
MTAAPLNLLSQFKPLVYARYVVVMLRQLLSLTVEVGQHPVLL